MAYDREEIYNKAIDLIKNDGRLVFIEDLCCMLQIDKSTFYNWKFHESQEIKDLLGNNRITMKMKMRENWLNSDAPALQMGLYKLIGTREERQILSNTDVTSNGKSIVVPATMDKSDVEKRREELRGKLGAES